LVQQYCASKGWTVYKIFTETKTGATLEREQLSQLLHDAEDHKFDVVAVTKLDRISRSVRDFLELDETFTRLGIDVVVTTQNIDTTSPAGKMQRNIMLAFAEFERDMIADRTRERLFDRAQKGYWGGGNVLLGYDVVDKKLIVNEKEAVLVKQIFESYLENPSTRKVAQLLNEQGFRTKVRHTKGGKTLGGSLFNSQNIYDMLNNRIYIGFVNYKDQLFKGFHEAIIDEQIFNRVQDRLAISRNDRFATHDDSELVLLGLIKCGFCERGLTTSFTKKDGKKYFYYKCTRKTKLGASECEERDIPAEQVEGLVERLISRLGDDNAFFDAVFKQAETNEDTVLIELKEKLAQLMENRALVTREINQVNNFIAKAPDTLDTTSIYAKIAELQESQKGINNQIVLVEKQISLIEETTVSKTNLREAYSKVGQIYSSLDKSAQRKIARGLITEIEFKYKKSEQTGEIKMGFRGDGTVVESWDKNINLETLVSRFYVQWLRE
jgi:site-specific DNA recombinase